VAGVEALFYVSARYVADGAISVDGALELSALEQSVPLELQLFAFELLVSELLALWQWFVLASFCLS
jgi:hypothetical protein